MLTFWQEGQLFVYFLVKKWRRFLRLFEKMTAVFLHFGKNYNYLFTILIECQLAIFIFFEKMRAVCLHFWKNDSCLFTICVSWTWGTCQVVDMVMTGISGDWDCLGKNNFDLVLVIYAIVNTDIFDAKETSITTFSLAILQIEGIYSIKGVTKLLLIHLKVNLSLTNF